MRGLVSSCSAFSECVRLLDVPSMCGREVIQGVLWQVKSLEQLFQVRGILSFFLCWNFCCYLEINISYLIHSLKAILLQFIYKDIVQSSFSCLFCCRFFLLFLWSYIIQFFLGLYFNLLEVLHFDLRTGGFRCCEWCLIFSFYLMLQIFLKQSVYCV